MSKAKQLIIKEGLDELKKCQRNSTLSISLRIRFLIATKKAAESGESISKRELAHRIGVDPNSIQKWRKLYEQGGIEPLLHDGRIGFKPAILTVEEHKAVEAKLNDPQNGLRGYVELKQWVEQEFGKVMRYNTLLKYCRRNFGSNVKVARKSHVKKEENAVVAFKKTSANAATKS